MNPKTGIKTADEALEAIARYENSLPFFNLPIDGRVVKFAVPNHKCLYFATSLEEREAGTNTWIRNFPDGAVFFDIGANVGIFSVLAASCTDAEIFAFEPHFASYHALVRTVIENALQDRLKPFPLALCDKQGFGSFFVADSSAGKSLNQFGEPNENYRTPGTDFLELTAISSTVDAFVTMTGTVPTHIKIDVDGLELAILKGATKTLANTNVASVLVELEGEESEGIILFMQGCGFSLRNPGEPNAIFDRP